MVQEVLLAMEIQRCCSGGTRTKRICSKPACSATSQRVWKDIRKTCPGHLMSPEVQNGHNDVRRYLQSWKLSATECFIRKHVASNKTPVARRMCHDMWWHAAKHRGRCDNKQNVHKYRRKMT